VRLVVTRERERERERERGENLSFYSCSCSSLLGIINRVVMVLRQGWN
jgi:hypothetical protein